MGIFGHTWDKYREDLKEEGVIITLELEETLDESKLVLKGKKGEDIELYIRDSHQATQGSSISKGKSVSRMNHGASVKLQTPKEIVGTQGAPIEIHNNEVYFNVKEIKSLEKVPANVKKVVKTFLEKNIEDLNTLWDGED